MSMMDKLRQMLKGHGEHRGNGKAGRSGDEKAQDQPAGQVDKGPDALTEELRSQQERENPPQP